MSDCTLESRRGKLAGCTVAALTLMLGFAISVQPAEATAEVEGFQTPTKNINCTWRPDGDTPVLECMIDQYGGKVQKKPADCDLDWGPQGTLEATGRAELWACRGDTSWWPEAPVLAYGSTWRKGPFTCSIAKTGVTCKNTSKRGFFISRNAIRAL
jgi:hypothetical protein